MTESKEVIGRRIREYRMARGMSARQLAELVEMSPGYLSEVERGLSSVSGEILIRIARELGTSIAVLVGEEPQGSGRQAVEIPKALSEAAEKEGWSYRTTMSLLRGKSSLRARRSSEEDREWEMQDWLRFYNQVKDYIDG